MWSDDRRKTKTNARKCSFVLLYLIFICANVVVTFCIVFIRYFYISVDAKILIAVLSNCRIHMHTDTISPSTWDWTEWNRQGKRLSTFCGAMWIYKVLGSIEMLCIVGQKKGGTGNCNYNYNCSCIENENENDKNSTDTAYLIRCNGENRFQHTLTHTHTRAGGRVEWLLKAKVNRTWNGECILQILYMGDGIHVHSALFPLSHERLVHQ